MKKIIALMLFLTFFAHANDSEPGSQYLKAAEAGDRRAQYFLADSWFSSGDLSKAEYWAQKAADSGDADACALLAQIKITNPVSLDYPQAKVLAEKAAQAGSKEGEVTLAHILVSKITVLILGVIAIILGVLFENQNIAFMVGLAFAIAASCNFPIILLSMYWSKLTTRGAMMGGWLGLITAVVLMILGPTIWVQILGHEKAIFPYEYPALFSITVAFLGIWFFSATDNSAEGARERELFRAQFIRSQTGFGVEQGRAH